MLLLGPLKRPKKTPLLASTPALFSKTGALATKLATVGAGTRKQWPIGGLGASWGDSSQVKLLLPKFHRADSALRSQAAGDVGACVSVAPPAFGCRLS